MIDCYPQVINHLCEYTKQFVLRALNLPKQDDYGFKVKLSAVEKYLLIKYPKSMVKKILKELYLNDEFVSY